jgi:hypothetical protein
MFLYGFKRNKVAEPSKQPISIRSLWLTKVGISTDEISETDWQAFQGDVTEQFGLLGNAPDLYSEGPRFESLLRHGLS